LKLNPVRQVVFAGVFIGMGVLLPMAFHAFGLGRTFLPMHIPVLVAGLLCGPVCGLMTGLVTPLLSSVLTGMPPMAPMPTAQMMVFELGAYGLLAGVLSQTARLEIIPSLIGAMIGGRLVYGALGALVLPLLGFNQIPLLYPVTAGLVTGIPGVLLQLVVVPPAVRLLQNALKNRN